MYTKHCTPIWTNKGFQIGCVVLNYGIIVPSLVVFYAVITFYLRREGIRLNSHDITRPTFTLTSSVPSADVDRSRSLTIDQMETQTPASKDDSSFDDAEADHHGNKEDDVPVPPVTANRKADSRRIQRRRHRAHSRVARLGAVLVFTNILCWTPYLLFHLNYIRVSEDHWFGVFTMWLGYCNTVLDPLVYSCMNRRVRAELLKLSRRLRCCGLKRSFTVTK
ncbi:uncharacterized protein [Diadema antillarum]|uniref:uncharacterized protein n=1 Tax=Diadema antillarum TaxID=105358 RepID=UPI003A8B8AF9